MAKYIEIIGSRQGVKESSGMKKRLNITSDLNVLQAKYKASSSS